MQRLRLTFGFLRAVWLAGRHDLKHKGFWRTAWGGVLLAWGLIKLAVQGESAKVSPKIRDQRLLACFKCPVYCHELQTCGDARELDSKEPFGCLCFMPFKSSLKSTPTFSVMCWLHEPEQGDGRLGGWPKEAAQ